MKVILEPKKAYNDFKPGEECIAKFGPLNREKTYPVTIVAIGRK